MAEKDQRAARTAAVMSTAAAVAAGLAWLRSGKAYAAEDKIPPELMNLVIAMAQTLDHIDVTQLQKVQDAIKALSLGGARGWPENTSSISTTRVVCPAALSAVRLPDLPVPDGFQLQIKAWPFNGNLIYVAGNRTDAPNVNQVFGLAASEAVSFGVKNARFIYIAAVAPNDSVCLAVEQRPGGG